MLMDIITSENILLIGSIILVAGVVIGKLSYKFGLPLLLIFLFVGMGFGVDGVGIKFDDMHSAQFVGMIGLCVILFSGGFDTKYSAIRPVITPGLTLATAGVALTALFTGLFVWWLSGMQWSNINFSILASLLVAATMSSTDSASVFGILGSQKVGLKENLRPMLELESGSNDPMAYMLTIMLIQAVNIGDGLSAGAILMELGLQFVVGVAIGFGMGKAAGWMVKRYGKFGKRDISDDDQSSAMVSIMILGIIFLTFSLATDLLGNGYLAVYICGIVLGNTAIPYRRGISRFMGGTSWLSQVVMFLMLGLLVNPHEMLSVTAVSVLIGLFMIFVGRPLSVMLCLLPFRKVSGKARLFVSWVGLRGAVPIIFATYPVVAEVPGASQLFNIVFFVTLLSLLIQGSTVIPLSKKLKLTEAHEADESDFGVEISDALPTQLKTVTVTTEMLDQGDTLSKLSMPKGQLVIMIRRNNQHIIPNGTLRLQPNDVLLLIESDTSTN